MKWIDLWMKLFGRTELYGINMGFWVSLAVVIAIVIIMNLIFWNQKPKKK